MDTRTKRRGEKSCLEKKVKVKEKLGHIDPKTKRNLKRRENIVKKDRQWTQGLRDVGKSFAWRKKYKYKRS